MNRVAYRSARLIAPVRQPFRLQTPLTLAFGARPVSSVAEVSFWKSLVPKPLRDRSLAGLRRKAKVQKDWNPATFFIFIFLLIGSMSIQMISLKRDFSTFMRQSDVRIGLLREVVEKLQKGEDVDVERVLGTGDAEREQLWEQGLQPLKTETMRPRLLTDTAVLREIEREEPTKQPRKKQPEPTPGPPPEAAASPAPEAGRVALQSPLASKGFF